MRFWDSKKGSLSLSINAIVVLILAITMLGLGLGFMKKTFGGVTNQFETVSSQMHKEMVDRLKESAKRVLLNVYEIDMKQSEKKTVYLAIKDELAASGEEKKYSITVESAPVTDGEDVCPSDGSGISYLKSVTLNAGEAKVLPIYIKTSSSMRGHCHITVTVTPDGDSTPYGSQDLFLNIK